MNFKNVVGFLLVTLFSLSRLELFAVKNGRRTQSAGHKGDSFSSSRAIEQANSDFEDQNFALRYARQEIASESGSGVEFDDSLPIARNRFHLEIPVQQKVHLNPALVILLRSFLMAPARRVAGAEIAKLEGQCPICQCEFSDPESSQDPVIFLLPCCKRPIHGACINGCLENGLEKCSLCNQSFSELTRTQKKQ